MFEGNEKIKTAAKNSVILQKMLRPKRNNKRTGKWKLVKRENYKITVSK